MIQDINDQKTSNLFILLHTKFEFFFFLGNIKYEKSLQRQKIILWLKPLMWQHKTKWQHKTTHLTLETIWNKLPAKDIHQTSNNLCDRQSKCKPSWPGWSSGFLVWINKPKPSCEGSKEKCDDKPQQHPSKSESSPQCLRFVGLFFNLLVELCQVEVRRHKTELVEHKIRTVTGRVSESNVPIWIESTRWTREGSHSD